MGNCELVSRTCACLIMSVKLFSLLILISILVQESFPAGLNVFVLPVIR